MLRPTGDVIVNIMQSFVNTFIFVIGLVSVLSFTPTPALAHGDEPHGNTPHETLAVSEPIDAEAATRALSFQTVGIAAAIIGAFVLLALIVPNHSDILKHLTFWAITLATVVATAILGFVTVNLNVKSWSNGPIHWHADFEVWACGQELDLVDPSGLSNKIGSPSRHEHNDKRLHYEGVVMEPIDASLSTFFTIMGGTLTASSLTFPTNDGVKNFTNGESCAESDAGGALNIFVYSVNPDNTFSQRKVDPATYTIRDESQVPPGDCIIIEFGDAKDKTDKLCRSYKVAQEIDKLGAEVPYDGN